MPRLTRKCQVTIPKEAREILGIVPGDQVEFKITPNRQVLVDKATSPSGFDRYVGYLTHKAGRDPDQIVADMRGEPE